MPYGLGWVLAGVGLLGVGLWATLSSDGRVWYGAIIVGGIWIIRGIYRLATGPKNLPAPPA